jgi:hypothetical protein
MGKGQWHAVVQHTLPDCTYLLRYARHDLALGPLTIICSWAIALRLQIHRCSALTNLRLRSGLPRRWHERNSGVSRLCELSRLSATQLE